MDLGPTTSRVRGRRSSRRTGSVSTTTGDAAVSTVAGRAPDLIADWAPTVTVLPDVDPTGAGSGGSRLFIGVRGRLH